MPQSARAPTGAGVLDLTQFEAGMACTHGLAWLGAEVIQVRAPGRGEPGRLASRDPEGVASSDFLVSNGNRRGIPLSLGRDWGHDLFPRPVRQAVVVSENLAPGTVDRLGVAHEDLTPSNPRLTYAPIEGFAPDGPTGRLLAFEPVAETAGGLLRITGPPGDPPLRPGPAVADSGAGLL